MILLTIFLNRLTYMAIFDWYWLLIMISFTIKYIILFFNCLNLLLFISWCLGIFDWYWLLILISFGINYIILFFNCLNLLLLIICNLDIFLLYVSLCIGVSILFILRLYLLNMSNFFILFYFIHLFYRFNFFIFFKINLIDILIELNTIIYF